MADAARASVQRLQRRRVGQILDVSAEMARVTLEILERTIFTDGLGQGPEHFREAVTRYFDTAGRIDPLDLLGFPYFIPRIGQIRSRPTLRFFRDLVDAIIATRRKNLADPNYQRPHDLLTLLLEAKDPETGVGLDEEELRANIITFIGAGHETTANALTWSSIFCRNRRNGGSGSQRKPIANLLEVEQKRSRTDLSRRAPSSRRRCGFILRLRP